MVAEGGTNRRMAVDPKRKPIQSPTIPPIVAPIFTGREEGLALFSLFPSLLLLLLSLHPFLAASSTNNHNQTKEAKKTKRKKKKTTNASVIS